MKSINLLIKPVSSNCNLNCDYCFYNDISKKREKQSYGMMNYETLENIVKKAIRYCDYFCTFAFQGGEPTLAGLDFYEKFVELVNRYNSKKVKTIFSIQTNGILLNEEWAKFLYENNFLVGISLDSSKETHNLFRLDNYQKGTFNHILKVIDLLNKYKVEYNILTVVTSQLAKHPQKVYNFYKSKKFSYLQFIPVIEPFNEKEGERYYSLKPKEYTKFLKTLFDYWYRDFQSRNYVSIRLFDNLVRIMKGYSPEACEMNGICSIQNVIEADGSIFPCDFYVFEEYNLGNINEIESFNEILTNKKSNDFIAHSKDIPKECTECKWFDLCRNGCRRYRYKDNKYYFCESYKEFFEYSYERLLQISNLIS